VDEHGFVLQCHRDTHRYALSFFAKTAPMRTLCRSRDVEALLFERGIEVSRESIRTWCINFGREFAQDLYTLSR